MMIKTLPDSIVIALKRFNAQGEKVDTPIYLDRYIFSAVHLCRYLFKVSAYHNPFSILKTELFRAISNISCMVNDCVSDTASN